MADLSIFFEKNDLCPKYTIRALVFFFGKGIFMCFQNPTLFFSLMSINFLCKNVLLSLM
jgi:hypothetical protein